jgi:hypothetical protein
MCMDKDQCESCFDDLQRKGNELFVSLESRHEAFLDKMEKRHNQLTVVNMSILGMFGLAIAYIFAIQLTKAARAEALSIKQAEKLEETMTKYYDQRFVHIDGSKIDESTYKWHIKTILESNPRSAIEIED